MKYNEVIKQIMIEKNLSQENLGKILQVNQTTISQWIRGKKKPSFDNVLMFYEKLGVEPNELFGIE